MRKSIVKKSVSHFILSTPDFFALDRGTRFTSRKRIHRPQISSGYQQNTEFLQENSRLSVRTLQSIPLRGVCKSATIKEHLGSDVSEEGCERKIKHSYRLIFCLGPLLCSRLCSGVLFCLRPARGTMPDLYFLPRRLASDR